MKIIDCLDLELNISPRQAVMLTLVAQAPKEIPEWFQSDFPEHPFAGQFVANNDPKVKEKMEDYYRHARERAMARIAQWPWKYAQMVLEAEPEPDASTGTQGTPDQSGAPGGPVG